MLTLAGSLQDVSIGCPVLARGFKRGTSYNVSISLDDYGFVGTN
jgi:hypothetical protein